MKWNAIYISEERLQEKCYIINIWIFNVECLSDEIFPSQIKAHSNTLEMKNGVEMRNFRNESKQEKKKRKKYVKNV